MEVCQPGVRFRLELCALAALGTATSSSTKPGTTSAPPEQLLATAAPHSSPWLPDGYLQHHEQAASALVAPAELPVVDLHARIQPGLHIGRGGHHGLHSGAVT
jgi:hypothetical protein